MLKIMGNSTFRPLFHLKRQQNVQPHCVKLRNVGAVRISNFVPTKGGKRRPASAVSAAVRRNPSQAETESHDWKDEALA